MSTLEITITKGHMIVAGIAVGVVFLGVALIWLRKIILPAIFVLGVLGVAAGAVQWKVRDHFNHKKAVQAQVGELPPDFRMLYQSLENCHDSATRKLALSRFVEFRDTSLMEQSNDDAWITPFQYEAFLELAAQLGDISLEAAMAEHSLGLMKCVRFSFEL